EILFKEKSPYQLVEVLDTYAYGKMLSIDKMVMTTDKDEYVYHEMIAHPAMLTHNAPKKVLVIGGGDGGTIREVLKHESVEQVVMVEIDGAVVEACKEHFPKIASQFDNPKLELIIGDGIEYVKNAAEKTFDVVIIDGSDPVGPAEGLFSKSFFQNVNRVLKDDGIMVAQSESPRFNENAFIDLFKVYDEVFGQQNVYPYTAYIPTYPSGMWAFAYCTKKSINIDRLQVGKIVQFCQNNELDYYNLGVHQGAFSLPNFVKKMLGR
ncbi:MAG: polyamine aminopropyltransferase, partial [Chitinophagales bacterium]